MKIISKRTQWDAIKLIVTLAKQITPSSFNTDVKEQFRLFDEFTTIVTDIVCKLGGLKGLCYLESECGISSNKNLTEEKK